MTALGLGTYRCRDMIAAAQAAIAAGIRCIDTAPVYAGGTAHLQLAGLLADHPSVKISTKVGHMTLGQAESARRAGVLSAHEAARGHSIAPAYVDYQITTNAAELRRQPIDLVYLHNPEHDAHRDRDALLKLITEAFSVCEKAAADGQIGGYGVATWSGFSNAAFTVPDLLGAARTAAGSSETHMVAIQLPVSLVQLAPLAEALNGTGPISEANTAGLEVWASAPLNGGELAKMVTGELAALIGAGLSPAAAALAVVASTPGLTGALLTASSAAHWQDALTAFRRPPIPTTRLREICRVLRA